MRSGSSRRQVVHLERPASPIRHFDRSYRTRCARRVKGRQHRLSGRPPRRRLERRARGRDDARLDRATPRSSSRIFVSTIRRSWAAGANGHRLGQYRLGPARLAHCMRWIAQAETALDMMVDRALHRYSHGSLSSREAGRAMVDRRLGAWSSTNASSWCCTPPTRSTWARSFAPKSQWRSTSWPTALTASSIAAMQVHGALGYSTDTPLATMLQHARWARLRRRRGRDPPDAHRGANHRCLQGHRIDQCGDRRASALSHGLHLRSHRRHFGPLRVVPRLAVHRSADHCLPVWLGRHHRLHLLALHDALLRGRVRAREGRRRVRVGRSSPAACCSTWAHTCSGRGPSVAAVTASNGRLERSHRVRRGTPPDPLGPEPPAGPLAFAVPGGLQHELRECRHGPAGPPTGTGVSRNAAAGPVQARMPGRSVRPRPASANPPHRSWPRCPWPSTGVG